MQIKYLVSHSIHLYRPRCVNIDEPRRSFAQMILASELAMYTSAWRIGYDFVYLLSAFHTGASSNFVLRLWRVMTIMEYTN